MRTSSPAAATMLTSQKPASATSAWAGTGSPASQLASCGAARMNASGGSQGHERNSAMAVVPTSVTATNRSVSNVGEAPTTGGAIRAAMSPKAATLRAS